MYFEINNKSFITSVKVKVIDRIEILNIEIENRFTKEIFKNELELLR